MTCHGAFLPITAEERLTPKWANSSGRCIEKTANMIGIVLDVDFCDWPNEAAQLDLAPITGDLQADRKTRKSCLYAMSPEEIHAWEQKHGLIQAIMTAYREVGWPQPHMVRHTGHGINLHWLLDTATEGWSQSEAERRNICCYWTNEKLRSLLKSMLAQGGLPYADPKAVDGGTRLFAREGDAHRVDARKRVHTLHMDLESRTPLSPVFTTFEKKYGLVCTPARRKSGVHTSSPTVWKRTTWLTEWDGLEPATHNGRTECPLCSSVSALRWSEANALACFACQTRFIKAVKLTFDWASFCRNPALTTPELTDDDLTAQMEEELEYGVIEDAVEEVPAEAPAEDEHPRYRRLARDERGYAIFPEERPTHLLLGCATGSGKTRYMKARLTELRAEYPTSYAFGIAPLRRLAEQMAALFGLKYNDVNAEESARCTEEDYAQSLCLASLGRVMPTFDAYARDNALIIMDEIEQMLSQYYTILARDRECYELLVDIIARAAFVILADAHIGEATVELLKAVNARRRELGREPIAWTMWDTEPNRFKFVTIQPTYRINRKGAQVMDQSAKQRGLDCIRAALAEGKRLAIAGYGRNECLALGQVIREEFPHLKVSVVVRDQSAESKVELNDDVLYADVLIYNAAMGTGVSLDRVGWYHQRYALYSKAPTMSGPQLEQALHRVRHPVNEEIIVVVPDGTPISDQRLDPSFHLQKATVAAKSQMTRVVGNNPRKLENYDANVSQSCFSEGARRMALLQAAHVASAYANGQGWLGAWLPLHHDCRPYTDAQDGALQPSDMAAHLKETAKEIIVEAAQAVAHAEPCDEDKYDIYKTAPRTDYEADSAEARRMVHVFGVAYEEANEGTRSVLVERVMKEKLDKKVELFASAALVLDGHSDMVATNEAAKAADHTVMTVATQMQEAEAAALMLVPMVEAVARGDGEMELTDEAVRTILAQMELVLAGSRRALPADWRNAARSHFGRWLSSLGLTTRTTQIGPAGARTRVYILRLSSFLEMMDLSAHRACTIYERGVADRKRMDRERAFRDSRS
jgi:hypothetical protein